MCAEEEGKRVKTRIRRVMGLIFIRRVEVTKKILHTLVNNLYITYLPGRRDCSEGGSRGIELNILLELGRKGGGREIIQDPQFVD